MQDHEDNSNRTAAQNQGKDPWERRTARKAYFKVRALGKAIGWEVGGYDIQGTLHQEVWQGSKEFGLGVGTWHTY